MKRKGEISWFWKSALAGLATFAIATALWLLPWWISVALILGLVVFLMVLRWNPDYIYRRLAASAFSLGINSLVIPSISVHLDLWEDSFIEILSQSTQEVAWFCFGICGLAIAGDLVLVYIRSKEKTDSDSVSTKRSSKGKWKKKEAKARAYYLQVLVKDVEARLETSIHHARFIDLGLEDTIDATNVPLVYRSPNSNQEFNLIDNAFNHYQGQLLILGNPGSGKTTTLLDLTQKLLQNAVQDKDAPIPIIVNLTKFAAFSSRASGNRWFRNSGSELDPLDRFRNWLIEELSSYRGISHDMAAEWVKEGNMAFLLDGLDEVYESFRGSCIEVINDFLEEFIGSVVVCSRINEYLPFQKDASTQLQLNGAVTLQPLNQEQIFDYLKAGKAEQLIDLIKSDQYLMELAEIPLILSMITLAYAGETNVRLQKDLSLAERRHELMEAYITKMLQRQERRKRGIVYDEGRGQDVKEKDYQYSPRKVKKYLGWLAVRMSIRMQTSFSLHNLYEFLVSGMESEQSRGVWFATKLVLGPWIALIMTILGFVIMPGSDEHIGEILGMGGAAGGLTILFSTENGIDLGWQRKQGVLFTILIIVIIISGIAIFVPFFFFSANAIFFPLVEEGSAIPAALLMATGFVTGFLLQAFLEDIKKERNIDEKKGKTKWPLLAIGIGLLIGIVFDQLDIEIGSSLWTYAVTITGPLFLVFLIQMDWTWPYDDLWLLFGILGLVVFLFWGTERLFYPLNGQIVTWYLILTLSCLLALVNKSFPFSLLVFIGFMLCGIFGEWPWIISIPSLAAFLIFEIFLFSERKISLRNRRRKTGFGKIGIYFNLMVTVVERGYRRWALSYLIRIPFVLMRVIPIRTKRFLKYSESALQLKRTGREYEFIHRMVRDHYALLALSPMLYGDDANERESAILALAYQGEAAIETLGDFMKNPDPKIRLQSLQSLSQIPSPEIVKYIFRAVSDPSLNVRIVAVEKLRTVNRYDNSVGDKMLLNGMRDDSYWVRLRTYCCAVQYFSNDHHLSTNELKKKLFEKPLFKAFRKEGWKEIEAEEIESIFLENRSYQINSYREGVDRIPQLYSRYEDLLISLLQRKEPSPSTRLSIYRILFEFWQKNPSIVPLLIQEYQNPKSQIRKQILGLLEYIGTPEVRKVIGRKRIRIF